MDFQAHGLVVLDEEGGVPAIRGAVMDVIQQFAYHMDPKSSDRAIEDGDGSIHRRMAQNIVRFSVVQDRYHQLALR